MNRPVLFSSSAFRQKKRLRTSFLRKSPEKVRKKRTFSETELDNTEFYA